MLDGKDQDRVKSSEELEVDEILAQEISRHAMPLTRWAVKRAAKSLSTETSMETVTLQRRAEEVHAQLCRDICRLGRILTDDAAAAGIQIRAIIGAGNRNLNPAVVDLKFIVNSPTECSVNITASAKEGLIKQQTAHGAIQRVVQALIK